MPRKLWTPYNLGNCPECNMSDSIKRLYTNNPKVSTPFWYCISYHTILMIHFEKVEWQKEKERIMRALEITR